VDVVELARSSPRCSDSSPSGGRCATGMLAAEDARPIHASSSTRGCRRSSSARCTAPSSAPSSPSIALVAWVAFAVSLAAAWAIARAFRLPRRSPAGSSCSAPSATPATSATRSRRRSSARRARAAIFYDIFGTVGALLLVGLAIAQYFAARREPPGPSNQSRPKEAMTFPGVIALAVALVFRPLRRSGSC
jgi:MFS family permease